MVKFIYGNNETADTSTLMTLVKLYSSTQDKNSLDLYSIQSLLKVNRDLLIPLNSNYEINEPDITSSNRIITVIKKIIRKSIRWYFYQIKVQQTQFNAYITQYLNNTNFLLENFYKNEFIKATKNLDNQKENSKSRVNYYE